MKCFSKLHFFVDILQMSDCTYFFIFFKYFYCISSDFSDLPDMTDEYIDLSVCSNWLVVIHIAFIAADDN